MTKRSTQWLKIISAVLVIYVVFSQLNKTYLQLADTVPLIRQINTVVPQTKDAKEISQTITLRKGKLERIGVQIASLTDSFGSLNLIISDQDGNTLRTVEKNIKTSDVDPASHLIIYQFTPLAVKDGQKIKVSFKRDTNDLVFYANNQNAYTGGESNWKNTDLALYMYYTKTISSVYYSLYRHHPTTSFAVALILYLVTGLICGCLFVFYFVYPTKKNRD